MMVDVESSSKQTTPPTTLVEFILVNVGVLYFFGMSLFDVYNMPMLVLKQGSSNNYCTSAGCIEDSLGMC